MEHRRNFLILVLLACGLTISVLGKPAANVEDNATGDYYSDDYEDDYDDNDNEVNRNNDTDVGALSEPAYFLKNEFGIHANEGSTVILECDAENFKATDVVIWYNNSRIIVQGGIDMQHNPRVRLVENNGIEIADVIAADAGIFSCQIMPSKARLNINLNIIQPIRPDVSIWYMEGNISDQILTVHQTDHVEITCQTKNIKNATIKWSLNGHRIDSVADDILVEEDRLIIDVVDHTHGGIYQCLADDRTKHPHMTSVTLDVTYPPKVSTHRHHINTDTNADAELYCEFKANPIGHIIWTKNGKPLDQFSGKYEIKNGHSRENNRNRTTLTIKQVKAEDLGEYTCLVNNSFGKDNANMYLSYNPEKPQFESKTINGNTVTLHWLVRSTQPLTEAIINYKIDKSYKWSTDSILNTKKHPDNDGYWKLVHTIELNEGLWHAQVKTKNNHGWSHFSTEHSFVVANYSEDEGQEMDETNLGQNVNIASFVPKNKNGGASSLNLSSFPGFIVLLLAATYVVRNL